MFKDLNLEQSKLESCLQNYCEEHNCKKELQDNNSSKRKVFKILKPGIEPARITFHLKSNGTTTIQINQGKNVSFNTEIASYIKKEICNQEIKTLNMSIIGISIDTINKIEESIKTGCSDNQIEILKESINGGVRYSLESKLYNDKLTLSYYQKSTKLTIQGKPLSCYRDVVYTLTSEIDLDTLAKIIYKKDSDDKNIVRKEMAEEAIKNKLKRSYHLLPDFIRKLLISSYCIQAASPDIPDYSLLTYCELRALEGIIKHKLMEGGICEIPSNVGELFNCKDTNNIRMKSEFLEKYDGDEDKVLGIIEAYKYYRRNRHPLFHTELFVDSSRKISSLTDALKIVNKIYYLIESMY